MVLPSCTGRRVFDVADLVKDAIVLPEAFICAEHDLRDQEFRSYCLQKFTEHKVLDFLFEEVKHVSQLWGKEGPYHDGIVYQSQ